MSYLLHDFLTSWLPDLLTYLLTYVMTSWFHDSRPYLFTSRLPDFTVYLSRYKSDSSNFGTQSQIKSRRRNMGVMKSHAEIQRAYRSRLKQQNPELLRMHDREKWRGQCLKKRSWLTIDKKLNQRVTCRHIMRQRSLAILAVTPIEIHQDTSSASFTSWHEQA